MELTGGHQRAQAAGPFRSTQLAQCLGFNLANPLTSDVELLADLFERMFPLAAYPETHPDYLLFFGGERLEDTGSFVPNVRFDHGIDRRTHPAVFNQIAQRGLAIPAHWGFQRHRIA